MAIHKRGKTYHVDVAVNGIRYRESLETANWQEAQRKQKELINRIMEGKAGAPAGKGSFASLPLEQALAEFVKGRVVGLHLQTFLIAVGLAPPPLANLRRRVCGKSNSNLNVSAPRYQIAPWKGGGHMGLIS